MRHFVTATKGITLTDIDDILDAQISGASKPISADDAKLYVPVVRRAMKKRAGAIRNVPFSVETVGGADVTDKLRFADIASLIYLAELSVCAYGQAYWHLVPNDAGFLWPQWYAAQSVEIADKDGKFTGFYHREGGVRVFVKPRDMLWFWQPDEDVEFGPGQAPLDAGLFAASALHNADKTVYGYFSRGAIRTTVFAVPQFTSEEEINKLKAWWERVGSAVRNAFTSVFYRGGKLEPTVVGDPLAQIWNPELEEDKRRDIADALDIPASMLLSDAANYATAKEERQQWYSDFVFPRCAWYADRINAQWLNREGLQMVYHPEQTEIHQELQMAQVPGLVAATGAGIITVNEARAMIGLEPLTPEQMPEPEPEDEDADTDNNEDNNTDNEKALRADIEKWERYARKRYEEAHAEKALQFQSAAIPPTLQASIRGALSAAGDVDAVNTIFKSAKAWAGYGFYPTL